MLFFFQIKTEDLSDSLQSTIPPRSGHLVQGSSMMPGSQIAGVSAFGASGAELTNLQGKGWFQETLAKLDAPFGSDK